VNEGVPVVDAVSEKLEVYWWLLPVHAIAPMSGVAVGPAALNVLFVNVADALHPVAAFTNVKLTVGEQMLGVMEKLTVCCPLTSLVVTPLTVPPEALMVS